MNISFLHPSALWFLPAAAGPLVIHLFFRRRPRLHPFSDLRFIRGALEAASRRLRLKQYILLILRTVCILLVVLFFSKPVWKSGLAAGGAKESPPAVVILIDTSYSMGYQEAGKTRFERCRQEAQRMLALMPPRARAGVVAFSDRVEAITPALSNDTQYLRSFIDGLKLSRRTTDLSAAVPAVSQLLTQYPQSPHTVVLLGDGARHGYGKTAETAVQNARIVMFPPQGGSNRWIEEVRCRYDENTERWRLSVSGRGNDRSVTAWPLSVLADGKKIGSDLVTADSGGRFLREMEYADRGKGISGAAELSADGLPQDDTAYFAERREMPVPVTIIDGDPKFGGATAESFYLRACFPSATVITEGELPGKPLPGPGVLILANVRESSPEIERFTAEGGGVIVFPGDHSGESFQGPYLPAAIGVEAEPVQGLAWAAPQHPVASGAPMEGFDWKKFSAEKSYVLKPSEKALVLARTSSGAPYIVEGSYGKGKAILFAGTADREWNNLPSRPVFVPLLRALARYAAGGLAPRPSATLTVGEPFRCASDGTAAGVETPSGKRLPVAPSSADAVFQATDEPGIYRLLSGGEERERFAVNLKTDTGEGDLTPVSWLQARRFFGAPVVFLPREKWESRFSALLAGRDISRPLLFGAVALLLFESLVAYPPRRREEKV